MIRIGHDSLSLNTHCKVSIEFSIVLIKRTGAEGLVFLASCGDSTREGKVPVLIS